MINQPMMNENIYQDDVSVNSDENDQNFGNFRRSRNTRRGRGRGFNIKPVQAEESKRNENDRGCRIRRNSRRRGQNEGFFESKTPIDNKNNPAYCEWFIEVNGTLKELPNFVSEQIERKKSLYSVIQIIHRGRLANIADLNQMRYFTLDINENRIPGGDHPLIYVPSDDDY